MEITLALIVGAIIGTFIRSIMMPKNVGTLRLDRSDPDGPYLFLEMHKDSMYQIEKCKYVMMEVKVEDYIPRE